MFNEGFVETDNHYRRRIAVEWFECNFFYFSVTQIHVKFHADGSAMILYLFFQHLAEGNTYTASSFAVFILEAMVCMHVCMNRNMTDVSYFFG